jgi:hypothetical protein
MTLALLHPGLLASVGLAGTREEVSEAIDALAKWSKAHETRVLPCRISGGTLAALYEQHLFPDAALLKSVYSHFGPDSTWHPNYVVPAIAHLLRAPDPSAELKRRDAVGICDLLVLTPSATEDPLSAPLQAAAKHDAARLVCQETAGGDEFVWVVGAFIKHQHAPKMEVHVTGSMEVYGTDGTEVRRVIADQMLLYIFDPRPQQATSEEATLCASVRKKCAGMQALLIGGDGRNLDTRALCDSLGLSHVEFLQHYKKGPGQNIQKARQMLKTGKYSLYIHITTFGSHGPANIKGDCPEHCYYVPLNSSPTPLNVARAIAQSLHLGDSEGIAA